MKGKGFHILSAVGVSLSPLYPKSPAMPTSADFFQGFSPASFQNDFPAGLPLVRISRGALRRNWFHLASLAEHVPPMAVIKADAYGHGLEEAAATLLDAGCRTFAVGSMDEGVLLRAMFTARGAAGKNGESGGITIVPLLGVLNPKDAASAVAHNLLPLVSSAEQAAMVDEARTGSGLLPIAVKVETGMSRFGVRPAQTGEFVAALRSFPNLRPAYLLSHLASADDPDQDAFVAAQVARFLEAYNALRAFWPDIALSLANSAGHLARDIHLAALPPQMSRPGYALYGGNPFAGTCREHLGASLLPVMEVAAPVVAVASLAAGQSVSYGATFTAEKDMRIAVIGAGYADGFSRGFSGRGYVCIRGERCPVLGRVCMQTHIVDVTRVPGVTCNDTAYILGGEGPGAVPMDELARTWGTIPYEVFCMLGKNPRVYV